MMLAQKHFLCFETYWVFDSILHLTHSTENLPVLLEPGHWLKVVLQLYLNQKKTSLLHLSHSLKPMYNIYTKLISNCFGFHCSVDNFNLCRIFSETFFEAFAALVDCIKSFHSLIFKKAEKNICNILYTIL